MRVNGSRCAFTGILREEVYSPGKVGDDRAILEETAAALEAEGSLVRLLPAERVAQAARGSGA